MMSVYTSLILGMQVLHSVLGGIHLTPYIQGLTRNKEAEADGGVVQGGFNTFAPWERDQDPQKLLRRLGKHFNPFWMSLDPPVDIIHTHIRHPVNPALETDIDSVNLTFLESSLQIKFGHALTNGINSTNITKEIMDLVKSWLVKKASCPVYLIWEDLGHSYWPRWLRRGLCSLKDYPLLKLNSQSAAKLPSMSQCSWPPGMHCVPSKTKLLKILLWQCRTKNSKNSSSRQRLPGMGNVHVSINRSKRHMTDSQYLKMQLRHERYKTRPLVSDKAMSLTSGHHGILTEGQRIPSGASKRDHHILPQSNRNQTREADEELKETTINGDREFNKIKNKPQWRGRDTSNGTDRLSSREWPGKRRGSNLRCRWVKVPYPVTDDCACSC